MIRLVLGPPCAGKSTYISEHAEPGDITLDWDALAAAIDAHATGTHAARAATVRAAATYARIILGHYVCDKWKATRDDGAEATAWIPITSPDAVGGLDKYIAAGATVTLVDPGIDECLARCEADQRPAGTAEAIRAWYNDPPAVSPAWLDTQGKDGPAVKAKTLPLKLKAAGPDDEPTLAEGEFIAYASTFDRDPDAYGDIIAPGAFTKTLAEWAKKDAPIPLFFGHRLDDPDYNIGEILRAEEDEKGLLVTGRIDLDAGKGPQVYRLVKAGRVRELSFSYQIRDAATVEIEDADGKTSEAYELRDLDLLEISLVQVGANRHTSVLAAKSAAQAAAKAAGDFTAAEQEDLRDALDDLDDARRILTNLLAPDEGEDTEPEDAPEASDDAPAEAADDETAKAAASTAARARLSLALATI